MSEEKGNVKGFLLGLLAGGLAGSLIALLYAPKSGTELRRDIKDKKNELLDDADEYMQNAKQKANELVREGKRRAESIIEDAKKKGSDLSRSTGELYNSGKEKISHFKDALKSGVDAYNDEREKSSVR